jgi:hypothetical protein
MQSLNIHLAGPQSGEWALPYIRDVILPEVFPRTKITADPEKPPQLILRDYATPVTSFDVPYIAVSGEAIYCKPNYDQRPLFFLDTCKGSPHPESVWCPLIVQECLLHFPMVRPDLSKAKRWCCAYAHSNPVTEREVLFRTMRSLEPTCYAFGRCSKTKDNPFNLAITERGQNKDAFQEFGFIVAMENCVVSGYLTEKIGHAFAAGSVPIYWGDTETVNDFFNPAAFLNVSDFQSPLHAGRFAVELWRDKQKLQRYLDAPVTVGQRVAEYATRDYRAWKKPIYDALRDEFLDLS